MALLALSSCSFFGDVVAACHSVRMRALDGAVARLVGLGEVGVTITMVAVNIALGVGICEYSANDSSLPSDR
jgi:hypothetical protein